MEQEHQDDDARGEPTTPTPSTPTTTMAQEGVKWTHNPKHHRLKRFRQIDTLMSFYWHACHLLMHDDHDLDGHLY